jgi:hypothetical protein
LLRNESGTAAWKPAHLTNSSATSQTIANADTYLTGSKIVVAAGDLVVGANYHCTIAITKTASGTACLPILRIGTAGTTSDTSIYAPALAAGTAGADTGTIDFWFILSTTGASATSLVGTQLLHNQSTAVGLWGYANVISPAMTAGSTFNSTTATTIGVSYSAGASGSHTVTVLRAELTTP